MTPPYLFSHGRACQKLFQNIKMLKRGENFIYTTSHFDQHISHIQMNRIIALVFVNATGNLV